MDSKCLIYIALAFGAGYLFAKTRFQGTISTG